MDFNSLLTQSEYAFLRSELRLGERNMLLGVSGSYGYGTNREGSDVDLRGVTLNLPSDFIYAECERQKLISETAPDDRTRDFGALNAVFREVLGGF